ncbi:hypothetical protein NLG97_g4674 [Lecanicillium saksenae]|uniref:Uncharacterized protein n=1 Tax=Lecanicillium saksenae TaxID=468837 RepID=A0ACC1QUL4_9HYPO|nr:hypothetical protein NLG97_g4674 [Lecanicillium saksenae]
MSSITITTSTTTTSEPKSQPKPLPNPRLVRNGYNADGLSVFTHDAALRTYTPFGPQGSALIGCAGGTSWGGCAMEAGLSALRAGRASQCVCAIHMA